MDQFITDDGHPLKLRISGNGTPLVLLHGWTSSHQDWFPFLEDFNRHHKVYRWDARGHGGHPLGDASGPTVERMARDLKNLLDHYALDKAILVGHSMGALTIWQYLQDHGSHRVGRIVLIDQSPKLVTQSDWDHGIYGDFSSQRNAAFIQALEEDFAEGVLKLTAYGLNERAQEKYESNARGWEKSRQWLKQQDPQPLIDCWASLSAADYRRVLKTIDVPALLIYGGASNFYHTKTANYVRDSIPNALLHIYEGTDHSPHLWQRERFVKDVLDFVA